MATAEARADGDRSDGLAVDLCIMGGGPAGLALATTAAACGKSVVLIEKDRLGGVSLTAGTVAARTVSAAAAVAAGIRTAGRFAITATEPAIDGAGIVERVRAAIAEAERDVSADRLAGLGVRVIAAAGRLLDARTVAAGEHRITARHIVLATGSRPLVPDIPGLADVRYLTTDTIFTERAPLLHLIVIGAGAAGTELAQMHRRLGTRVTLIDRGPLLGRFDPELTAVVRTALEAERITLHENSTVERVEGGSGRVRVHLTATGDGATRVEGSHLLIACGRRPTVADLGLEAAGVAVTADGITVDRRLRTSNRRIHAMGDVTGHPYSVQRAEDHARHLVASLVIGRGGNLDPARIPVALYTDPGIASVGLDEAEARRAHRQIGVHRFPLRETIGARTGDVAAGHIKVVTDRGGRLLGVGLVATGAAELIPVWTLAMARRLALADMAEWVAPHPTLSEVNRRVAVLRPAEIAAHAARGAWTRLFGRMG